MKRAHAASLALWIVAGVLLTVSLVLGSWWTEDGMRVGLGSFTTCSPELPCETQSFSEAVSDGYSSPPRLMVFLWAGRLTFLLGVVVLVSTLISTLVLAVSKHQLGYRLVLATTIALGVTTTIFLASSHGGMARGASCYLTCGAIVLLLLGCFTRVVLPIPHEEPLAPRPQWHRPGSAPPVGPWTYANPKQPDSAYAPPKVVVPVAPAAPIACPRCSSPMTLHTDHSRHFCGRCEMFA